MEGAGRNARAAAAVATKKKKNGSGGSGSPPGPPPNLAVPFDQISGISDALRDCLAELGATAPAFVIAKTLEKSDVSTSQARLFFSCKGASLPLFPLTPCLTGKEMEFVADDEGGLLVAALDRGGRRYDLTCRYLGSNSGYRFITSWRPLVEENGLRPGARVELWAFRSRQLPNRYEGEGKDKVPVRVDIGHADGSLGLVVLDYRFDGQHGGDAPAAVLGMKETELVTTKSEAAEPKDKLGADGGDGAAPAEPTMTKEDMTGFRMFLSAIGLIVLKRRRCNRGDGERGR